MENIEDKLIWIKYEFNGTVDRDPISKNFFGLFRCQPTAVNFNWQRPLQPTTVSTNRRLSISVDFVSGQ
jgi:hypothetical protein